MATTPHGRAVCGRRITLRERTAPAPRFFADAMLGRLARWLRLIGADTAYESAIDDHDLAARAALEDRIVLTRDTVLPRRFKSARCLLIDSEVVAEQLAQVVRAYDIDWRGGVFTRCTRCNTALDRLAREEVAARVPPRILLEHRRFVGCPTCRRVFWPGSHVEHMRAALARALVEDRGLR